MAASREHFGRLGVILALAGSAIGLGNIWRFPYMVGEYGGAAFIIVYLAFSFLISLPAFVAESCPRYALEMAGTRGRGRSVHHYLFL